MKFLIVQTPNNLTTWVLETNAGSTIATSSTYYTTIAEAQAAVQQFKTWVGQAPVDVVTPAQEKNWRQQAMEQLKKTPWQKG